MEEWKDYKLGNCMTVKGGKRLPKGKNLTPIPNEHPYIRVRDLGDKKRIELNSSFEYVDDLTQESISRYIVNSGDIIISIVGTIGLIAIIGNSLDKANLTENCVKLVDIKSIDREYLYYYLVSPFGKQEIEKGIVGAVQAKLPIKNIQAITIKAPNLFTQKRIASFLSSLDEKIELNRKINENLEQQAQALFKSWFVDFEPFRENEFVKSELGLIPKGWKVGIAGDLLSISKTTVNPSKSPQELFSIYSIPSYDNNKQPEIQIGKDVLSNKFIVKDKMILFSKLNPRIKRIWYVNNISENSICSTEFVPYIAKNINLSAFVFGLISSQGFYDFVMSKVNGATGSHQRFHPEESLLYQLAYNKEEAEKYSLIIEPMISKILKNQQEIGRLAELRDTLLPRLMSGELIINDI